MNDPNTKREVVQKGIRSLQLSTKIVLGFLATGGIALAVLAGFAYDRSRQVVNLLSSRLERVVGQQAEAQLSATVLTNAEEINQAFSNTADDVVDLANYRVSLQKDSALLGQGAYWDAHTKLIRLPSGQYGNPDSDIASIFVPSTVLLDESLLENLNTTAFLDFSAPDILNTHEAVIAVYFIDSSGTARYYPNINFAGSLPPDFDLTSQIYYKIATPLYNPQRILRWTVPYQDPAGTGLIVTATAPVYIADQFKGIVGADLQLENVSGRVEKIEIGQSGFAFLIDDAGHIVAMPPRGYAMFGLQPEHIPENEMPKLSVLGKGTDELKAASSRMVAGGTGLLRLNLEGVDTYLAFAHVSSPNYSLGLVVPVAELSTALISARAQTQAVVASTFRTGVFVLIGLFLVAFLASLGLSRAISAPVVQLTKTAEKITAGDLTARAEIEAADEIGRLAGAFNTMTARLRDSLTNLEGQVSERTADLERRSVELETVAELARDIASYRDLDALLSAAVDLIRERFGYYHAGVFFVDDRGVYAVLRAASGIAGQKMLEQHHRLKVGETGMVGYVTSTGQARVSLNIEEDPLYFHNPLLPETRSEITLPLRSRNRIIGALDIQSKESNAFTQQTIKTFQLLADQLVVAIEGSQLVQQVKNALMELSTTYRSQTEKAWEQTVAVRSQAAYEYDGLQIRPIPQRISSDDLRQLEQGKAIVTKVGIPDHDHREASNQNQNTLLVPLMLFNQVIGVIGIENEDPNYIWTEEEIAVAENTANRTAVALENARLLEASQRRAEKERIIRDITTKIGSVVDIGNIVETAVRELGQCFADAKVAIQLVDNENSLPASKIKNMN